MLINNDTIIKDNDPLIRRISEPVPLPLSEEDKTILREMLKYVEDSTDEEIAARENLRPAVGISGIQIGIPKQLTAVVVPDFDKAGNPITWKFMLANPKIVSRSTQKAYLDSGEGCLSVPKPHEGYVYRHYKVTVSAVDGLTGNPILIKERGFGAIVLQHEIDHLDGILFYDRIDKNDPFKKLPGAVSI